MSVVAVADPDATRCRRFAEEHAIPEAMRFTSHADLAAQPGLADAVINGTLDRQHYETTLPLLEAGYHVLLEKPIAPTEREVRDLIDASNRNKRAVMICHVLRYAPFYRKIKDLLDDGPIGSIVSMCTNEWVSYHHMAVAFVRGKWNKRAENPIMLAKCCHDLDLLAWFNSGVKADRVASFGSLTQFKPENAPRGAGKQCLVDCEIEPACAFSAKANYVDMDLWGQYAWHPIEHIENPTREDKLESLRTGNPYGRCVWHCDNDVVDHQTVIVEFANGVTATHNLFTGTARPTRTIHIVGTDGEIEGDMEHEIIKVRRPDVAITGTEQAFAEQVIDLGAPPAGQEGGHGGGDQRLIGDFISLIAGNEPSKSVTSIQDSLTGHMIAFAADTAMNERRVVEIR
jgi:predicted dehydrogenase